MKKTFVCFVTICALVFAVPFGNDARALSVSDGDEIILDIYDDEYVSFSGTWYTGGLMLPKGGYAKYTTAKDATVVWKPKLDAAENVSLSYFKIYGASNRKENSALKVTIYTEGKTTEKTVDFTDGVPGWVDLGSYNFTGAKDEYIKVTASEGTFSRATAIRIRKGNFDDGESKENILFGTDEDICRRLGMLLGDANGDINEAYLSGVKNREAAAVFYIRLLGLENAAKNTDVENSFSDIDEVHSTYKPYVSYLYQHPELGFYGTSDTVFNPKSEITYAEWGSTLLNYLGFKGDYTIDNMKSFAEGLGITLNTDGKFTLFDMVRSATDALSVKINGSEKTMLRDIIEKTDCVKDDEYLNGTQSFGGVLKTKRSEAKNRKRRIIYNNDGNDTYVTYDNYPGDFDVTTVTEPMTRENFLSKRTAGLETTQVDTVFYCTGVFNSYHHKSSGETDIRKRDWSWTLAYDDGTDSLETIIDWCEDNNKEVFWSMRMNDIHDAKYREDELDPWKREHLDLLMSRKAESYTLPYSNQNWSAVNYAYNEVRQKVYNILKDTVTRYDTDGIELDFSRFPSYFKEVAQGEKIYPENIERMNNLMRSIRRLTEEVSAVRQKPILISVYIPDSIGFNYEIGLDVKTWLNEDLIDMVTVGCTPARFQSWEASVKEYSVWDVPLYAAFDPLMVKSGSVKNIASEAAHALRAGVDGIYTYNIFNVEYKLFDMIGDKSTCGTFNPYYSTEYKSSGLNTYLKNGASFAKDLNNCTFFKE